MKHINNFKSFEAIIIPDRVQSNHQRFGNFEDLVEYGNENGFDVVRYEDFLNSLSDIDKKTAPPKNGPAPFFALFHPIRKRPMFVLVREMMIGMPDFKEIVDDIISHEKIHGEQNSRRGGLTFNLPDPNTKEYFNNKDEIMAFSWTIANDLSKTNRTVDMAIKNLDKRGREMYTQLWSQIKKSCDEETLRKYRKYIYMYLKRLFE